MNLLRLLNQNQVWVGKEGVEHPIVDMDGRYAYNVYNYLKNRHRQLAFQYGIELASMPVPDRHGDVLSDVDRLQEHLADDSERWLLGTPLLRALAARVAYDRLENDRAQLGPRPRAEYRADLEPYEAPEFEVKPPADAQGEQLPGDENLVFAVQSSDTYDSQSTLAVFVGNRPAAQRYAAEHNRYESYRPTWVEEFADDATGGPVGAREYRDPWTQVEFYTAINLDTSEVVKDYFPSTQVRNDCRPHYDASVRAVGYHRRSPLAGVTTTGPDTDAETLRAAHADTVNRVRANALDDATSFSYDGVRYSLRSEYTDAQGGRWRFTGELDDRTPFLRRVGEASDRRQERTLPDVVENFGPLTPVEQP